MSIKNYALLNTNQVIMYSTHMMNECNQRIIKALGDHGFNAPKEFLGSYVPDIKAVRKWVISHPKVADSFKNNRNQVWNENNGVTNKQLIIYSMLRFSFSYLLRKTHWVSTVKFFKAHKRSAYKVVCLELLKDVNRPVSYIYHYGGSDRYFVDSDWVRKSISKDVQKMYFTPYEQQAYDEMPAPKITKQKATKKSQKPATKKSAKPARQPKAKKQTPKTDKPKISKRIQKLHDMADRIGFNDNSNRIGGGLVSIRVWFKGNDLKTRKAYRTVPDKFVKSLKVSPQWTANEKVFWAMSKAGYYCEDFFAHSDDSLLMNNPQSYIDVKDVLSNLRSQADTKQEPLSEIRNYAITVIASFNHYADVTLKKSDLGLAMPSRLLDPKDKDSAKELISTVFSVEKQLANNSKKFGIEPSQSNGPHAPKEQPTKPKAEHKAPKKPAHVYHAPAEHNGHTDKRVWFKGTNIKNRVVQVDLPGDVAKKLEIKPSDTGSRSAFNHMIAKGFYYEDFLAHADGQTLLMHSHSLKDVKAVISRIKSRLSQTKTDNLNSTLLEELWGFTGAVVTNFNCYMLDKGAVRSDVITLPMTLIRETIDENGKDYGYKQFASDIDTVLDNIAKLSKRAKHAKKSADSAKADKQNEKKLEKNAEESDKKAEQVKKSQKENEKKNERPATKAKTHQKPVQISLF